ncbi:MAG: TatD family hydrolase [Burkholderiaceae bacterium]|jgi:TatD DNase family protein|nr:TatD family hydrolase [Burkholderiaceae bacterium]
MFTDSHCHLAMPELARDLPAVRSAMAAAQVTRALCISTSMEELPQVCALAQQFDGIWASVGVHPDHEEGHEPTEDELVAAAAHPRIVAVGETGLDYYQMEQRKGGRAVADLEWQRARFRTHIRAARRVGKPLVIHTRAAAEDTLRILREEGVGQGAGAWDQAPGVFHCFTESEAVAHAALGMGFYLSFSGIVTFKNAQALQDVARSVPLERILIETDAPYLAPVPMRGKTNSPAYVPYVAAKLAELRGTTPETIGNITSANFDALFLARNPSI